METRKEFYERRFYERMFYERRSYERSYVQSELDREKWIKKRKECTYLKRIDDAMHGG